MYLLDVPHQRSQDQREISLEIQLAGPVRGGWLKAKALEKVGRQGEPQPVGNLAQLEGRRAGALDGGWRCVHWHHVVG